MPDSSAKLSDGSAFTKDCQLVYERCLAAGTYISAERIQSFLPEGRKTVELAGQIINHLASQGLVSLSHEKNGGLSCKAESKNEAARIQDMDADEQMLYSYIKSAGTVGIWSKSLKSETNLSGTVIIRERPEPLDKQNMTEDKCFRYPYFWAMISKQ